MEQEIEGPVQDAIARERQQQPKERLLSMVAGEHFGQKETENGTRIDNNNNSGFFFFLLQGSDQLRSQMFNHLFRAVETAFEEKGLKISPSIT